MNRKGNSRVVAQFIERRSIDDGVTAPDGFSKLTTGKSGNLPFSLRSDEILPPDQVGGQDDSIVFRMTV